MFLKNEGNNPFVGRLVIVHFLLSLYCKKNLIVYTSDSVFADVSILCFTSLKSFESKQMEFINLRICESLISNQFLKRQICLLKVLVNIQLGINCFLASQNPNDQSICKHHLRKAAGQESRSKHKHDGTSDCRTLAA